MDEVSEIPVIAAMDDGETLQIGTAVVQDDYILMTLNDGVGVELTRFFQIGLVDSISISPSRTITINTGSES